MARPRRTEHVVSCTIPLRPIAYKDVVFKVKRGRSKFGELRVSQGGIEWKPRHAKKLIKKNWRQLEAALGKRD